MGIKKIAVIMFAVLIIGGYFFINYATNIPELMTRSHDEPPKERCDDERDIACIAKRLQRIDDDREQCVKVIGKPNAYFRESVEKCKSIMGLK